MSGLSQQVSVREACLEVGVGLRVEYPPGGPAASPQDQEAPRAGCSGTDRAHFTSLNPAHMFKMAALSYRWRPGVREQRNVPKVPGKPSGRGGARRWGACPRAPELSGCRHPQKACPLQETHSPEISREGGGSGHGDEFHRHHLELPHCTCLWGEGTPRAHPRRPRYSLVK